MQLLCSLSTTCLLLAISFVVNAESADEDPFPWSIKAELKHTEGSYFYFLDHSFLQGQTMALAAGDSRTEDPSKLIILGTNNGDFPRSWCSIIRPDGAKVDEYGQLFISEDGLLLGIRFNHMCFLAYDAVSRTFYGHGDVESISPFVLIGSDTVPLQKDMDALLNEVRKGSEHLVNAEDIRLTSSYLAGETPPGYPCELNIKRGLKHPNPIIRDLSRQLLEIHNDGIKKASARVKKHVDGLIEDLKNGDSSCKQKALETLGSIGRPGAIPAVSFIIPEVKNKDSYTATLAAQALGLIGDEGIPALLELLKSEEVAARGNAIFGIGMALTGNGIQDYHKEVVAALGICLEDEDEYVRRRARELLNSITELQ